MRFRDFPRMIARTCTLSNGARVLEAGCGSGRDSLFFSTLGLRCIAADADTAPLAHLKEARGGLLAHRATPIHLDILAADVFRLPFADNSFDLVFNSGVIEHFERTTRTALLREMCRVTRPGGFVVVVFPNTKHFLRSWWNRLTARYSDFDEYDIPELPIDDTIAMEVTSQQLEITLVDYLDSYDTISHYPSWLPLRLLSYAATLLLPRPPAGIRKRLGTRIAVVARKPS
ncbi:MAG TPA: class I SAM-dependent methyltransferase [Bacteroidota bacterium]|nr:class I SAM-dependent methyltransferase [Bacteroidota bacterium]